MKHFVLSLFTFSILFASDKTPSMTRYSDLTQFQKKQVGERLRGFDEVIGLDQYASWEATQ